MSYQLELLKPEQCARWDAYVYAKGGSIYHLSSWRNLIRDIFGHQSYYLFAANQTHQLVGILPLIRVKSLLFGDYLVSMPYFNYGGVLADNDEVAQLLLEKAEMLRESLGCAHAEYRHSAPLFKTLPVRTDKVTMLLQLPESPEELWKAIGSKRRAQIKRPIREGVEFKLGHKELLDDFYAVFSRNMRDLGTPVYSKQFFRAILDQFATKTKIAVVTLDSQAVGAGFLISHNGTQEIPWASTLRKYNNLGVNMFLYWNILKSAIESKHKYFDFGRSSKDAGTLRFKKQWGAEEEQLYWHYTFPEGKSIPIFNHSNKKYQLMINTWKKMPVALCNLLGPHIIKGLP